MRPEQPIEVLLAQLESNGSLSSRNMENNETLLFDKGDGIELSCRVR